MGKKGILKRAVTLGIVTCLSSALCVGCGGNNTSETSSTTGSSESPTTSTTPSESPEAEKTPVASEAPKEELSEGEQLALDYTGFVETPMDLGGRTIRMVTTAASRYTWKENKDETPNETIEIINAIESIEKDYNCNIEFEQLKAEELVEALLTAKAAGDTYCDLLEFGCSDTYMDQIYSANLVMPLEDEAISDIIKLEDNPWLPASEFGQMFGNQYGVHFKTNNSGDLLRGVVLFNKDLAEKYNLGDLYSMVDDKSWTFEKMQELCASVASQSDGTVYPILYNQEGIYLPLLIYANGGTAAEYKDGKYQFTGMNDKTLEALNYAVDLQTKGYVHPTSSQRKVVESTFANGESVFFFTNYASLKKYTQGTVAMEDSVGLLPAPLGPNGDGQYNSVSYTEALFHVMNNVEKPEEVAAVLVAIANRTGKHDMIETELMNTLQDEESAEMLDLMYNNMICDFSRTIGPSRSAIAGANTSILKLEKTPKEAYEEIQSTIQTVYDELVLVQ